MHKRKGCFLSHSVLETKVEEESFTYVQ
uniref:Uncharacterized protein n=1 Tax=Triticum urartu TaxID=4572 RepID=A0A8R7UND7_TRIUA